MSRGNRKRHKQIPLFKVYTSGISKAVWPGELRISVPTGRAAQRRRSLVIRGLGWIDPSVIVHRLQMIVIRVIALRMVQMALAVLAGGVILLLCMLYDWSILVILAVICMITTLIITHLLFHEEPLSSYERHERSSLPVSELPQIPRTIVPRTLVPSSSGDQPSFPRIQVPATPLIRVLETIDLSSTNIEHFLDIKTEVPPALEPAEQNEKSDPPLQRHE